MLQRRQFILLVLLLPVWLAGGTASAADEATALVKRTAERMLSALEARRAEVERDPSQIFGMVEDIVAPHFDFVRITQGALGRHWQEATPQQQQQLVDAFKQVLIRTYARSLLSYSGQQIQYLPVKPGSRPSTVTVSTEVHDGSATPIPVDYRMYSAGGAWKVFDVVISNASLVGNYRSSFATQVRQGGIDSLVAKLGDMNRQGQD